MKTKGDLIEEVNNWVNIEYDSVELENVKLFVGQLPDNFSVPYFIYYGKNEISFPTLTWTLGGVLVNVVFCDEDVTYEIQTDGSTMDVRCPVRKAILSLIKENIENE